MLSSKKAIDLRRCDPSYAQAEQQIEIQKQRNALVGGALALGIVAAVANIARRINPFKTW